jgi:hypothetical protein
MEPGRRRIDEVAGRQKIVHLSLFSSFGNGRKNLLIERPRLLHLEEVRLLSEQYPTRNRYPFNIDVLQKTRSIKFSSPVTFFIGENGSGKTTLTEDPAKYVKGG